jgi:hypothetical protein
MFGKTSLFILASTLGGLVGHLFKETGWAVTIEAGVEKFAHAVGLERSAMIGVAAPYVLALGAAYALAFVAYRFGTQERSQRPHFDILLIRRTLVS